MSLEKNDDVFYRHAFACLVVLLGTALLSGAGPAVAAERPNILIISLDDLNDWLGCYGGHPDVMTPNIDRLAERAMVFTNAHCVSPICGPSRAAVLTGMRPETTGVYHNRGKYVDYVPDAVTFPEHFRAYLDENTITVRRVNMPLVNNMLERPR